MCDRTPFCSKSAADPVTSARPSREQRRKAGSIDIQPEMIAKAAKHLKKKGITKVELTVCEGHTLPYTDSMFDGIYLITVLGEITEQAIYAKEMFRILKPGGIVPITDQGGDPDALSLDEVKSILEPAGFVFEQRFGRGRTYTANFKKP